MKYPIPIFSSSVFTWKGKHGSAEASDFGVLEPIAGVYAGSKGFYVASTKTGEKRLFTYVHDEDGYDGEFQVYSNGDIFITIFND